jgi:hypothetical protein
MVESKTIELTKKLNKSSSVEECKNVLSWKEFESCEKDVVTLNTVLNKSSSVEEFENIIKMLPRVQKNISTTAILFHLYLLE